MTATALAEIRLPNLAGVNERAYHFYSPQNRCTIFTLITCCGAFADAVHEASNFPDSKAQIEAICSDKNSAAHRCAVVLRKSGRSEVLMRYPFPPANIEFDSGIFSILFSCGTGCSATYFYNEKFGLTKPFPFVIAKNSKIGLILNLSENSLCVYKMFQSKNHSAAPVAHIDLGLSPDSDITQSVSGASPSGSGFIIYYVDGTGSQKEYFWKS